MEEKELIRRLVDRPIEFKDHPERQDDTEFVRTVVAQNGLNLEFASPRLRGDLETARLAVAQDSRALEAVSEELKNNREIILAAVSRNGEALQYVDKKWCADREIALAAATSNGAALKYLPEALREDREIILAASRYCSRFDLWGEFFPFVPKRFLSDKEIALRIVKLSHSCLSEVDPVFLKDADVLCAALEAHSHNVFDEIPEELFADKAYVKRFLAVDPSVMSCVSEELRGDKELALIAMNSPENRYAFEHLPAALQSDAEVLRGFVLNMEEYYGDRYYFDELTQNVTFPEELTRDDAFMKTLLKLYWDDRKDYEGKSVFWKNRAFALRAIELGADVSPFLDDAMKADAKIKKALAKAARRQEGGFFSRLLKRK